MWLSKKLAQNSGTSAGSADLGDVTISAGAPSMVVDSEVRGVRLIAPGGYAWRPKAGETILVLKDSGGQSFALGPPMDEASDDIAPGEVVLKSDEGSFIRLRSNGDIVLCGNVRIEGELTVNGTSLPS